MGGLSAAQQPCYPFGRRNVPWAKYLEAEVPPPAGADGSSIDLITYKELLGSFDAAVCEAMAVGQASAGRLAAPYIGYTTKIFARLCSHAQSFVRAAPLSRWTRSDAQHWDFGAVAGHARTIMEGALLFNYLSREPESPEEWSTRLLVMHLNDCTRRERLFTALRNSAELAAHAEQADDLRRQLRQNPWFCRLSQRRQNELLSGQPLTVTSREQQIEATGLDKATFDTLWQLFSQYAHILPISFYRMEANGRGTGLINDADLTYIGMGLEVCTSVMASCTDRMIEFFPDVSAVRRGAASKFAPGPRSNLPRTMKRRSR